MRHLCWFRPIAGVAASEAEGAAASEAVVLEAAWEVVLAVAGVAVASAAGVAQVLAVAVSAAELGAVQGALAAAVLAVVRAVVQAVSAERDAAQGAKVVVAWAVEDWAAAGSGRLAVDELPVVEAAEVWLLRGLAAIGFRLPAAVN